MKSGLTFRVSGQMHLELHYRVHEIQSWLSLRSKRRWLSKTCLSLEFLEIISKMGLQSILIQGHLQLVQQISDYEGTILDWSWVNSSQSKRRIPNFVYRWTKWRFYSIFRKSKIRSRKTAIWGSIPYGRSRCIRPRSYPYSWALLDWIWKYSRPRHDGYALQ